MDFLQWISEKFSKIADAIIDALPKSPISYLAENETVSKYLGYVNYFIPVYLWISILEGWLIAVVTYYVFQVILRWIKVIE